MAKKAASRPRGRPKSDDSMGARVLVRMDAVTKKALVSFASRSKIGAESTAARIIIAERLKAEGLL